MLPFGYGVAWFDGCRAEYICYPWPFNISISLVRKIWLFCRYRYFKWQYDHMMCIFLPPYGEVRLINNESNRMLLSELKGYKEAFDKIYKESQDLKKTINDNKS
jgi:hypothetical protein